MIHYDIEWSQLLKVSGEIEATDKQVRYSLSRAMRRTEATLRKMSSKGLTRLLQLRSAGSMRKRLKSIQLRKSSAVKAESGMQLWYGLNPLPVSSFKGTARKTDFGATKGDWYFEGGFVAKLKAGGKQTIFKRKGKERLKIEEQTITIKDQADVYIEDEVFDQVETIFWQHFKRDLQARVKFNLGES